ncbi:hypothetical protein ES332_A09G001000v1 [Gossypium tomentosum]|uniref:Uncharacterized protein n=1 Tax=Gossypium tomentosum TaxID=34277 RepID=A0A5D2NWH8_GOSTO|nr:hypothetical protein ES332_A09G001000v1 [Gossypium tomentosum]
MMRSGSHQLAIDSAKVILRDVTLKGLPLSRIILLIFCPFVLPFISRISRSSCFSWWLFGSLNTTIECLVGYRIPLVGVTATSFALSAVEWRLGWDPGFAVDCEYLISLMIYLSFFVLFALSSVASIPDSPPVCCIADCVSSKTLFSGSVCIFIPGTGCIMPDCSCFPEL